MRADEQEVRLAFRCRVLYCTVPRCWLPATGPVVPPITWCRLPVTRPVVSPLYPVPAAGYRAGRLWKTQFTHRRTSALRGGARRC